jgi:hypothetical protein
MTKGKSVVIAGSKGADRFVITDETMRRRFHPPLSKETAERIDRLEKTSAQAAHRLKSILMD